MSKMCITCGGKGFNWVLSGTIVSHDRTKTIADTWKQGEHCYKCGGTGKSKELNGMFWALLIGLLVAAFVIYNIPAVPV